MTCIYSAKSVDTGTINGAQSVFQPEIQHYAGVVVTEAGGKFMTTYLFGLVERTSGACLFCEWEALLDTRCVRCRDEGWWRIKFEHGRYSR
jgi:hypothetical protein